MPVVAGLYMKNTIIMTQAKKNRRFLNLLAECEEENHMCINCGSFLERAIVKTEGIGKYIMTSHEGWVCNKCELYYFNNEN